MRRLVDIIGGLIVALGIVCVLGGSMVPTDEPWRRYGAVDWLCNNLVRLADLLPRRRTTCPQCGGLAKFKALKCKHCGTELTA